MSRGNYHKHDLASFSLYTTASHYISDHTIYGQKKPGKQRADEVPCLDKPVLA